MSGRFRNVIGYLASKKGRPLAYVGVVPLALLVPFIARGDLLGGIWLLAVGACLLILYFLPSIAGRNKNNFTAIWTLNLLLGWTLVGWVVALIWALSNDKTEPAAKSPQPDVDLRKCPSCAEMIQREAKICKHCGREVPAYRPFASSK